MSIRITNLARDAIAAAFNALLSTGDGSPGVMKIYDGTKPTDVDDTGTGTLLSTMTFVPTAWNVSTSEDDSHGELTLFSSLYDDNTAATGTPTWGMVEDAEGNKLLDFESPLDIVLPDIEVGGTFTISEFTLVVVPGTGGMLLGDLNLNGVVDGMDFLIMQRNFGQVVSN